MARKSTTNFDTHNKTGLLGTFSKKIALIKFVYAAVFLSLINIIIVLAMQKNLPPQVPLFYGLTENEQQLTTPFGLLLPGIFSLALVLVNSIFSILIANEFLKKILSITSFTISLLSLITVLKIIFLVGYF